MKSKQEQEKRLLALQQESRERHSPNYIPPKKEKQKPASKVYLKKRSEDFFYNLNEPL